MEQQSHKVKSADRVLDIFELFTGGTESYNLTEISKNLNMPPSSTYLLLQNMLKRGYLEVDKSGKQFRIGYKLFMIQNRYSQGTSLSEEFYQVAEKIAFDLNETVSLAIRSGSQLHYIGEKISTQGLRYTPNQGETPPLHATASGKIFLAHMTKEELLELYPTEQLEKITDKTIGTLTELLEELEKVKSRGIGYNMGETVTGVHCVAAAVFDAEQKVVASISISIPVVRITDELWSRIHDWIERASSELSRKVYG
ncbi:IclR family transcriptional regulator [Paenibacillus eucommiae]|uniref:DNA-binding IclR family transcriptional regulator n=1 Tax=Paenibacillus eucommiae TaxID=1355755 RepID=A0ABS4J3Y7_9BACL|nr:IclR family transcriptional regulator [Paenibacillus eucommiae]MBP1994554.1 DNA-binding IclR family transcriptional regulator [Paenibacillus eucommiae]